MSETEKPAAPAEDPIDAILRKHGLEETTGITTEQFLKMPKTDIERGPYDWKRN